MKPKAFLVLFIFNFILLFAEEADIFTEPLGLPSINWPENNPYSKEKAELGKLLFFDRRLSTDESVSCASCHSIPKAFSDHLPVSRGIHGKLGTRHAPSLINVAFNHLLFWDGRADSLEEQAIGPLANPNEMSLRTTKERAYRDCVDRIKNVPGYRHLFEKAFGNADCSIEQIAQAIATFERTILSGHSAFDRYQAGDKNALTDEQIKGYEIFKASGCAGCHSGPNFTNNGFANIGIGMDVSNPDLGRYEVTQNEKDIGAFKIPTLRDVSRSYPYMHDGSLKTLEEVVEYYNKGGIPNSHLSHSVRPLYLTEADKKQLVLFLKSLDGEGWENIEVPRHLPR